MSENVTPEFVEAAEGNDGEVQPTEVAEAEKDNSEHGTSSEDESPQSQDSRFI